MHNETLEETSQVSSRALVPVDSPPVQDAPAARPLATFIMQVLACEEGMAAYRIRRRAGSREASTRYDAVPIAPHRRPARLNRVL